MRLTQLSSRLAGQGRALGNKRLRRVLLAYLAFNMAEWASWIAVLVWAYAGGGVRTASVVALAQLLPAAVLAAPAAAMCSRRSRSRALLAGYGAQATGYVVVAVVLAVGAPFAGVAVAAAVASVAITLTRPVHNALLPEIADTPADLTAGNAASGGVEALATLVGPLLCGVLLALSGPAAVLTVCAALTLVAGVLVTTLGRVGTAAPPLASGGWSRTREVLRDPASRALGCLVVAEYALVGMMDILLVVLALDLLDMSRAGPGLLNSMLGIGGMIGAIATWAFAGRDRMAPILLLGGVLAGVPIAAAGLASVPWTAMLLVAAGGMGKVVFDVASRTLAQRLLPDRLLIGLFGLQESLMMGGLAVGSVLAPVLVTVLGPRAAFVGAGLFLPAVAATAYLSLRRADARTVVPLDVLVLLREVPMIAVLAPRVVERLALEARARTVPAGDDVVLEGDRGEEFYVIAAGEVAVRRGDRGLRQLGPGGWFGELALLRDIPRTATVHALTDVEVWAIGRDAFLCSVGVTPDAVTVVEGHAEEHYR